MNMPPQDFSYVVHPVFADSEIAAETKLKELYSAEECSVAAIGMHKIDENTSENTEERYWLKAVLLSPQWIVFPMDSMNSDRVGEEIARFAMKDVVNADDYQLIQVSIVQTGGQRGVQSLKVNLFYRLPGFEVTTLGMEN